MLIQCLLIDDDDLVLEELTRSFKKWLNKGDFELEVDWATTAAEGIAAVSKQAYDLILCDYVLPGATSTEIILIVTQLAEHKAQRACCQEAKEDRHGIVFVLTTMDKESLSDEDLGDVPVFCKGDGFDGIWETFKALVECEAAP